MTVDGVLFLKFSEALKKPKDIKLYGKSRNVTIESINQKPEELLNIMFIPNNESY